MALEHQVKNSDNASTVMNRFSFFTGIIKDVSRKKKHLRVNSLSRLLVEKSKSEN